MSNRRLMIVGAGGHAKVVIEVAQSAGWQVVAAFDPGPAKSVLGVPVVGGDAELETFWAAGKADAAIIAIGDNHLRQNLAEKVRALGCPTPHIAHATATISPSAQIGAGTVIMAGAVINAAASIGQDCIINTAAIIEHDCVVQNAVHAAPRSVMGGGCHLGARTLFGIGATARPGTVIGHDVVVGAGAVVVTNFDGGATVVGNPARIL